MIGKIALHVAVPLGLACSVAAQSVHMVAAEQRVQTPHSYTGRMCAASRWVESKRPDSLFSEPQAKKLAGAEGLRGGEVAVRDVEDRGAEAALPSHSQHVILLGSYSTGGSSSGSGYGSAAAGQLDPSASEADEG